MPAGSFEAIALAAADERDASLAAAHAERKQHGIVHTPGELSRFLARAVDEQLQETLGLGRGLADARVQVIDPACGPGAFLAAALDVCAARGGGASTLLGIDRDASALAWAQRLTAPARQVCVELALLHADTLRDAALLERLRHDDRVLALLANPPWTVSAMQPTAAMQRLLDDFRRDHVGAALGERKLGVLSDAYVRFVRWACELSRARSAGAVLGFVTNGSFLDGPVHRGMRAALARWFDRVDVIDLGGNALLGRARGACKPDGNVFGVRTGVAITLCVRAPAGPDERVARVRVARLWGKREDKLRELSRARASDLSWVDVGEAMRGAPFTSSAPRVGAVSERYASWPSLAQWFPFHREGVQSNRDQVVIDADRARLLQRLRAFASGAKRDELQVAGRALAHYDPDKARRAVARALAEDPEGTLGISVRAIGYRPFDVRWFSPVSPLCHRPRPDLLRAFDHGGVALVSVRKDRGSAPYAHFAACAHVIDNCFLSGRSSCRARAFPCFTPQGTANVGDEVRLWLAERCELRELDPQHVVFYALAVLAAPRYRSAFDAPLHADYARVPLPPSRAVFDAGAALGAQLAACFGAVAPGAAASGMPAAAVGVRVGHHDVPEAFSSQLGALCEAADRLAFDAPASA